MKKESEAEYILGEQNIDFERLNFSRVKQSVESLFYIIFFILIFITLFSVEEMERVEKKERSIYPYNNSLKLKDIREIKTYKEVVVTKGDSIYKIFNDNGISYTNENIEKLKQLNLLKNSLKRLQVGETLKIPISN